MTNDVDTTKSAIRAAALDPSIIAVRMNLARFTADTFLQVGKQLHVFGHIVGTDRRENLSPFGHGDDAVVAISTLLRISGELILASADLIDNGRGYAGAALIRQLVEVEYLAWAFETSNQEAARWLRSTRAERQSFFSPVKLRKAADGRFRGIDYGYHCEWGGHPTPSSWMLLNDDIGMPQLMLSDGLGHTGRIWDHIVRWAIQQGGAPFILAKANDMLNRYSAWKLADRLTELPPPPAEFPEGC